MSREPDGTLDVLRGIWSAQGQTSADLDDPGGDIKSCKRMASVGFGDIDGGEVDVRAAWRARLEREGKLHPAGSVADLVLGPSGGKSGPAQASQDGASQGEASQGEASQDEASRDRAGLTEPRP
jgi:hypothetical protein